MSKHLNPTEENDPLQALISKDTKTVNRAKLSGLLTEYISFEENGEIGFKSAFLKLDNFKKIEIVLAAVKAKSLLFEGSVDRMAPSKIIELDIIPAGSVKSAIKKLFDDRKIKKDKDGYFLPNYRIDDLLSQFNPN